MLIDQIKALASDIRMQMLEWLKDPEGNFPPQGHDAPKEIGICMTHLQHKAALSASSTSSHLAILQQAGLVEATRIGKWTYFRRNEAAIAAFAEQLKREL
ncbi:MULTISPECIES: ArsR/SmtB family transcription factor [Pseudomonas]|jgi:DNA-binding transcriptional ArsR family regulator|uniref:Helix-turn-helix transcriptional regulator n=1 Tax=Pseudomonas chlororaphis TaxID=587753 RepID=A0A3G7HII0_9PSED|nr:MULTISPECIES: helix-turn-helix transcriptional regulator [Pseudomonas]AMS15787.1 transcriptional regulator [Pseudomonas chlororaphis]AUG04515.1 transcriptional regulator [Pseudomonas sp. 09C 129]AVO61499.1 transcriptional regulator [Pseudomonas chlororaphis subsp. piscium]AZC40250.1 transcriptional regulator, ArsR family [Pseudomonas chlororaphis subsp. piscium]AZC46807.1 transcriptional regulator, ArsR family [Pseudomonas chlororaphis subsp. piscium]